MICPVFNDCYCFCFEFIHTLQTSVLFVEDGLVIGFFVEPVVTGGRVAIGLGGGKVAEGLDIFCWGIGP